MTIDKRKIKEGWSKWICGLQPYAGTTVHFLKDPFSYGRSDIAAAREIAWVKEQARDFANRLDQTYFGTPHVRARVAAVDRFDAVCVVEKVDAHPHLHMAWFQEDSRSKRRPLSNFLRQTDSLLRKCCILETFNRSTKPLLTCDSGLLDSFGDRRLRFEPTAAADWKARGWSVFSHSLSKSDWPEYMLKEITQVYDFTDQIFFLSELRSEGRRTKATRYHSIDRNTKIKLLDLDMAQFPKR